MIPTAPDSKPIECSPEAEMLSQAYSILREVKFYFGQLTPNEAMRADIQGAARDFCLLYEKGKALPRPQPQAPARSPIPPSEF